MSALQKYSESSIIEESKARQVCSMEDQITFTDVEYGNRKRTTKREEFLNKMDEIIPWEAWVDMIRPYLTNEVVSYIPKVSQANGQTVTKKVTTGNVIDSTKTVLNDTAVNGTISAVTGKIAGKIVPTNNGWFKPQKFVSSFAGKYAIKSELQTLTQSGLLFGVEGLKYSFNQRLKQGQQPIVTFFPDTEIRAAG